LLVKGAYLNSAEIKTKVLHYFRFKRRFFFIATEAGRFLSDILVANDKDIIECEVKTSERDLKADLIKAKHKFYLNIKRSNRFCPTKFYFAVPTELVSEALIITQNLPYGVLEVDSRPLSLTDKKVNFIKVINRASRLQKERSPLLLKHIVQRCGSEIIRTRIRLANSPSNNHFDTQLLKTILSETTHVGKALKLYNKRADIKIKSVEQRKKFNRLIFELLN
jgi:hypothetical protein